MRIVFYREERVQEKKKILAFVPLGSEINLGLQIIALILLLLGLSYAIKTHNGYAAKKDLAPKSESVHKNIMTVAVLVSGLGVIIWMVPNFILGWFYNRSGLGYGSGGYLSYFESNGTYYPHWYLIPIMVVVGTITAILGVYLVLRMRWKKFPQALAVQNFRAVMIFTWAIWFLNILLGFAVFYFFAYLGTA